MWRLSCHVTVIHHVKSDHSKVHVELPELHVWLVFGPWHAVTCAFGFYLSFFGEFPYTTKNMELAVVFEYHSLLVRKTRFGRMWRTFLT